MKEKPNRIADKNETNNSEIKKNYSSKCVSINNENCRVCTQREDIDGKGYYWCKKYKKSFKSMSKRQEIEGKLTKLLWKIKDLREGLFGLLVAVGLFVGGIIAGVAYLGGFWGGVFGFFTISALVGILVLDKDNDDNDNDDEDEDKKDDFEDILMIICFTCFIGGIFAGKVIGGFWWVILGILLGGLTGFILAQIKKAGGLKAVSFPFLMAAGGIFTSIFINNSWWAVILGVLAGGIFTALLWKIVGLFKLVKQKRLERIEKARPFEDRLADLERQAQEEYQNNSTELEEAKRMFSEFEIDIDKEFELCVNNPERWNTFKTGFKAFFNSNAGVQDAELQVMTIKVIADGFAARYRVSAARAKLENDIYTKNRKKVLLLFERLNDIYDKLTAAQKKRKIEDAAQALKVGGISVKIPDRLPGVIALAVRLSDTSKQELIEYALNYGNFRKETNLSEGTSALVYLAGGLLMKGFSNYENNEKVKLELLKYQEKLIEKIPKLEEGRLQADGFSKRTGEINRALEGAMNAYEKMFMEIYSILYPQGDISKSKESRKKNKKKFGYYFSDEEAEAVIQLRTTGQFLLNLVDIKF